MTSTERLLVANFLVKQAGLMDMRPSEIGQRVGAAADTVGNVISAPARFIGGGATALMGDQTLRSSLSSATSAAMSPIQDSVARVQGKPVFDTQSNQVVGTGNYDSLKQPPAPTPVFDTTVEEVVGTGKPIKPLAPTPVKGISSPIPGPSKGIPDTRPKLASRQALDMIFAEP